MYVISYRQAQTTVLKGVPLLQEHNVPTQRPDDYFAEMLKSDQHMNKVGIYAASVIVNQMSNIIYMLTLHNDVLLNKSI